MRSLLLLIILATSELSAIAQSNIASGEIRGLVTDSSSAVIVGASVTVTNLQNGLSRSVTTDERGVYQVLSIPAGRYEVRVESPGFGTQLHRDIPVLVGQTAVVNSTLEVGSATDAITVTTGVPLVDTKRTQQADAIDEDFIRNLPIDRRDYLTFTLLAPGIADSNALADNTDFRIVATRDSGLSFYGSNGRGNSVTVDGSEANNALGGIRPTVSQEAVQEFEINRSNYSAEFGGASGGVINIVTRSGTNEVHGSLFGFFRHNKLDAADPFAVALTGNKLQRIKPSARRQQYGGTIGFPIRPSRTFFFGSFEGLNRNEFSSVSVLTDRAVFAPTAAQNAVIDRIASNTASTPMPCLSPAVGSAVLPAAACAAALRRTLTSKKSTIDLFEANSGVFPDTTDAYSFSGRIDHSRGARDQLFSRYSYTHLNEGNQSTRALVGFSRSSNSRRLDSTIAAGWTRSFGSNFINEARLQWNYDDNFILPNDRFGPEINISGFGFFNRDVGLPSLWRERRYELVDNMTFVSGRHRLKAGTVLLIRAMESDLAVLLGGRVFFGTLPGTLVSPALDTTSITALQAFDLGLAQTFQIGVGSGRVESTTPFYGVYLQDSWDTTPHLTLTYGMRYEVDDRRDPLRTDKNNFAPRFGFSWAPSRDNKTVVRGGYGIFYSPIYYQIDWVTNALNEIGGYRQIAQVLSTFNAADPLAVNGPINIYQQLRAQGVIGLTESTRGIQADDLSQFGISFSHTGPRPPLTVLFRPDPNYRNSYSQQASLGFEREINQGLVLSVNYVFAKTLKIPRARDMNLLPRPIGPRGIREWTAASGCTGSRLSECFRDPTIFQENTYESSAAALYNGATIEGTYTLGRNLRLVGNYTFSKAQDEVTDYNADFQPNDQTNIRLERALSAFDQRHKIVAYASFQHRALGNAEIMPVFRANSARPFNLLAGTDVNGDRHSTTDRPIFAGRNTGIGPDFWTIDLRVARKIPFLDSRNAEITVESFNLFNRLNFGSVNNTGGPNFSPPFRVKARRDLGPSQPLGFTSALDARRIQVGARINF